MLALPRAHRRTSARLGACTPAGPSSAATPGRPPEGEGLVFGAQQPLADLFCNSGRGTSCGVGLLYGIIGVFGNNRVSEL